MAAVMAGVAKLHPEVVGNFFQGTTRWLMNDPNSSMKRIMDRISDRIPIVYVNVDYSDSPYEGLQAYEWGFIKEGVGCGGASVGAIVESAGKVTCKDLSDKVHEIYRGIMGFEERGILGSNCPAPRRPRSRRHPQGRSRPSRPTGRTPCPRRC